jgi:broad specificity phosphatase PhoE
VRDDLNEIAYGAWEGLTKEKVEQTYHDDYLIRLADPAWHAPTEGELATVVARRGLQVVAVTRSAPRTRYSG